MSKGGSKTSATEIPKWLEDAVIQNLNAAKSAAQIGYIPYYGPEVAALSPMERTGMQSTMDAMSAFGMAPAGAQYTSNLPPEVSMGGVSGYSSGGLYDAALKELNARAPDAAKRYTDFYAGLSSAPMISNAPANPAASMPGAAGMSYGGGSGDPQAGRNYWAEREAQVGPAQARLEQEAQNQKINDTLTSIGNIGVLGFLTGGTPGNTRAPVESRSTQVGGGNSFSGAGVSQTNNSLSSTNTGGYYG